MALKDGAPPSAGAAPLVAPPAPPASGAPAAAESGAPAGAPAIALAASEAALDAASPAAPAAESAAETYATMATKIRARTTNRLMAILFLFIRMNWEMVFILFIEIKWLRSPC